MPGPGTNEALVTAIFPTLTPGGAQETHVLQGQKFFATVQTDVGTTAFGLGEVYRLHVIFKNLVTNVNAVTTHPP